MIPDYEVLLAVRDTLAGTATLNWAADTPITEWDGVMISGSPERIHSLDLTDNQLTGEIPPEIGNLYKLERLDLSGNQLAGCVPAGLRDVGNNDFQELGLPFCDD